MRLHADFWWTKEMGVKVPARIYYNGKEWSWILALSPYSKVQKYDRKRGWLIEWGWFTKFPSMM